MLTRPCSSHAGSGEVPASDDGRDSPRQYRAHEGAQLMAEALGGFTRFSTPPDLSNE